MKKKEKSSEIELPTELTDEQILELLSEVNAEVVLPVLKDGSVEAIKAFFFSDKSVEIRAALHRAFAADKECIKDCSACIRTKDTKYFLDCFEYVIEAKKLSVVVERPANISSMHEKAALQCSNCFLAERCPKYKVGANCAFDFTADTDFTDVKSALQILVNIQRERVLRGVLFEKVDGGVPDKNVTSELEVLMGMLQYLDARENPTSSVTVSGTGQGAGLVASLLQGIFAPKSNQKKSLPEAQGVPIADIAQTAQDKVPAEKKS